MGLPRYTPRKRRLGLLVALLMASASGAVAGGPAPGRDFLPLRAALHVHTTYSTGKESMRQVVERARERALDVVVFADDDLLRVEYGLPPLRRLLRVTREHPSLFSADRLQEYLDEIRRLDEEFPDLILIDGVESAPYYHWDVDWGQRLWTVRGWNKHLTAIGLQEAAAYRRLPILGGPAPAVSLTTALWSIAWPLIGLVYAGWLGRRLHGGALRALVALACLLVLLDGALGGIVPPRFSPYRDAGSDPYQAYIDAVIGAGGLVFWGHPEGASTIPPAAVLGGLLHVRSQTPAHAADLERTRHYTGFAALYADNITATEPGHEWDRTLTAYLAGQRQRPAWGTGEIDYHVDEPGGRIDDIQTVLWVSEASRAAVLEALARGRSYAVRGGQAALSLERWSLRTGSVVAVSGERADVDTPTWQVGAVVDKVNGDEEEVRVRLIRGDADGSVRVVADVRGRTPLRLERVESDLVAGNRRYYRLMARSRTSILTSNPVFIGGAADR